MTHAVFTILPNELLVIVFEYLKSTDIIYSFSNLNRRFDILIQKNKEYVNLCNLPQALVQKLLPLIDKHVLSLKIDSFIFTDGTDNGNLFQQFPWLKELSISNINSLESKLLPFAATSFNHLRKLQLIGDDQCISSHFLSKFINKHTLIEELVIESCILSHFKHQSSVCNITKLEIRSLNCVKETLLFLIHCPKVKVFKCHLEDNTQQNNSNSQKIWSRDQIPNLADIPDLKEFHLESIDCETDVIELASLIKHFKSLEILSLNLYLKKRASRNFQLDGHNLVAQLLTDLNILKIFQFCFDIHLADENLLPNMNDVLSTFQTDFWLEKHDWKVCGFIDMEKQYRPHYSSGHYCLFTAPFLYSSLPIILDTINMQRMVSRTDLSSSKLFGNVLSATITSKKNDDSDTIIHFLYEHFKKLSFLNVKYSSIKVNDSLVRLKSVKKLTFERSGALSMAQFLRLFPNLIEIYAHECEIFWDATERGTDNGAFAAFLVENLKTLKIITIECDFGPGTVEEKGREYFAKYLPNVLIETEWGDED